ncbi:MAG: AAA family ATPase [Deltaproteobacteria bacterium]
MKKVVTAVNHIVLNQYFKKNCPDLLIEKDDIKSQEELLKMIKEDIPDVLVLSDELPGKYDKKTLIDKIRKIDRYFKLVIITSSVDKNYKKFLNEKGIFDILLNDNTQISDLIETIENEGRVVVKVEKEIPKEIKEEIQTLKKLLSEKPKVIEKHVIIEKSSKTQKQEIIAVAGLGGAGKSDFLVQISTLLAKMSQAKILCIDLNTEFPTLNYFFGMARQPEGIDYFIGNGKDSSLNYMVDSIDKDRFDSNVFQELVVKYKKNPSLDVLTGNNSLYDCQNTLNTQYYKLILDKAKEIYDFIFIDTSSNLFLDSTRFAVSNATKVFFVVEPNIANIQKAATMLEILLDAWDVGKNKTQIIINKMGKYSLDKEFIKELLAGYQVCSFIDYDQKHEYCLNSGIPFVNKAGEKENGTYRRIIEDFNFVEKRSFLNKLFLNWFKKVDEKIIELREES